MSLYAAISLQMQCFCIAVIEQQILRGRTWPQAWATMEGRRGHAVIAQDLFKRAAGLQPNDPRTYSEWAAMEKRQGNVDVAKDLYRKAVAVDPSHTPSLQVSMQHPCWIMILLLGLNASLTCALAAGAVVAALPGDPHPLAGFHAGVFEALALKLRRAGLSWLGLIVCSCRKSNFSTSVMPALQSCRPWRCLRRIWSKHVYCSRRL